MNNKDNQFNRNNKSHDDPGMDNASGQKLELEKLKREILGKFQGLGDLPLELEVQLGKGTLTIGKLLKLSKGSIISIGKSAGEPMNVLLNKKYVGKGEISVAEDSFNVRIIRISDSGYGNEGG